MINGVAKPIDNGNFLFLYCFANSVNNTIVINAMISGIGFNSGVAMLATRNKIVYMPNGIVTIYLKTTTLVMAASCDSFSAPDKTWDYCW